MIKYSQNVQHFPRKTGSTYRFGKRHRIPNSLFFLLEHTSFLPSTLSCIPQTRGTQSSCIFIDTSSSPCFHPQMQG